MYNYPKETHTMIYRCKLHEFKFHYKKMPQQMICWRLIKDFIANPDKYDFKKRMESVEPTKEAYQLKIL